MTHQPRQSTPTLLVSTLALAGLATLGVACDEAEPNGCLCEPLGAA